MRILFFSIVWSLCVSLCQAQSLEREVVATSGDFGQNTEGSLSATIGEAIIETGSDFINELTQGFQQPDKNSVIPVELADFTGFKQDKSVKLEWKTYSERHFHQFDIEKSKDGRAFFKIGEIQSKGHSATIQNYSFMDVTPFEGYNYYRLKIIDNDFQSEWSKIITVLFDMGIEPQLKVFPTIATDKVWIQNGSTTTTTIKIYNTIGHLVLDGQLSFDNNFIKEVDVQNFPSGAYLFVFHTQFGVSSQKVIKQ